MALDAGTSAHGEPLRTDDPTKRVGVRVRTAGTEDAPELGSLPDGAGRLKGDLRTDI